MFYNVLLGWFNKISSIAEPLWIFEFLSNLIFFYTLGNNVYMINAFMWE